MWDDRAWERGGSIFVCNCVYYAKWVSGTGGHVSIWLPMPLWLSVEVDIASIFHNRNWDLLLALHPCIVSINDHHFSSRSFLFFQLCSRKIGWETLLLGMHQSFVNSGFQFVPPRLLGLPSTISRTGGKIFWDMAQYCIGQLVATGLPCFWSKGLGIGSFQGSSIYCK